MKENKYDEPKKNGIKNKRNAYIKYTRKTKLNGKKKER